MFDENSRGECVKSLHEIDYNWYENTVSPIPLQPKIIRAYENIFRDDNNIIVRFMPTGRRPFKSLGNFLSRRENTSYKNYVYCEEIMVSITVITKSDKGNTYTARELGFEWLRRIEKHIRMNWYKYGAYVKDGSFKGYVEDPHLYVGAYNIYRMDFMIYVNHSWNDEPEVNPTPAVSVLGADVEGLYFRVD